MQRNGVCYDVGRTMMGQDWRPDFDPAIVRRELAIIHDDLHCNAVRLQGFDLGRLTTATTLALDAGLEVWFSPEMWDRPPAEMLPYLADAAARAERLRRDHPDRLVFSVGSEISLFAQGFVPGANVLKRLANPKLRDLLRSGALRAPINAFLAAAARTVRAAFGGPLTYASLGFEEVDWGPFDFVGADLYRGDPHFELYPAILARYAKLGKPLANLEFGCCTFSGAERWGGRGWQIVDLAHRTPRLTADVVYDPGTQAREDAELLRLNDAAGVNATFVFTFVEPGPSLTPRMRRQLARLTFDPDLPHYSLVRTLPEGQHGTTYPDLPWEPKESFRAVAEFYATHPPRAT